MSISPHRAAVLALHWQHNVIEPGGFFGPLLAEPVARDGVVGRATRFHQRMSEAGVPLVFTRFTVPDDGGALVGNTAFMRSVEAGRAAFHPDGTGSRIIEPMDGTATRVVDNQKLSGLAGNDLPEWLTARGIDTLLVTGVATNLTVEQTCRHATDLGFTVHPVSDCCAAATPETHAVSLANLELTTAGCLTAEEVRTALRTTS
ncbi:cysteine hydrolase [Amycolatopsis suaedae]|uniref:Cysteine hydrolase n=1 Tax=Amycolatopsis suaedae TaxID=2510978 RepID=A0A4Q7J262_9PSEU|nr:cysteine hydrolase [Amycolatopsis suaedae]RZQ61521.1 cysteine hydrolase [Amycolatopsis suaedae]